MEDLTGRVPGAKTSAARKTSAKRAAGKKTAAAQAAAGKRVVSAAAKKAVKRPAAKRTGAKKVVGRKAATKKLIATKSAAGTPSAKGTASRRVASLRTTAKTTARKPATTPQGTKSPRRRAASLSRATPGLEKTSPPPARDRVAPVAPAGIAHPPARAPRSALPSTYGESHVLLLARDPQTLFAAWDVSPSAVEGLKTRIGRRGFAVSSLTLRLTPSGGRPGVFHLGKRVRSRYLKVEGGPSFVAEIGFTTPSGHFELVARSAPCFVSSGPRSASEGMETASRRVLAYGRAAALARQGVALPSMARTVPEGPAGRRGGGSDRSTARRGEVRPASLAGGSDSLTSRPLTAGGLGGASDLYRR